MNRIPFSFSAAGIMPTPVPSFDRATRQADLPELPPDTYTTLPKIRFAGARLSDAPGREGAAALLAQHAAAWWAEHLQDEGYLVAEGQPLVNAALRAAFAEHLTTHIHQRLRTTNDIGTGIGISDEEWDARNALSREYNEPGSLLAAAFLDAVNEVHHLSLDECPPNVFPIKTSMQITDGEIRVIYGIKEEDVFTLPDDLRPLMQNIARAGD